MGVLVQANHGDRRHFPPAGIVRRWLLGLGFGNGSNVIVDRLVDRGSGGAA